MSGSLLMFNADLHEYRTIYGDIVPSVTQILRATGVAVDFEELSAMSVRLGAVIAERRALGTAVHADAWAFDDDDLDWATVDPRVEPYLRAWTTFRLNTGLAPRTRERRVFHPMHQYAGTLDGIFDAPSGKHVLVDIKIGDPISAAGHLQTAAYEAAYLYEHSDARIDERWAVRLTPEFSVPYRITNYSHRQESWRDFQKFQACLTVFHEQPQPRSA